MSKTILIAGKNMPEAGNFTDGIAFSGRNIIVSGNIADSEETKRLTIAERKANRCLRRRKGTGSKKWNVHH